MSTREITCRTLHCDVAGCDSTLDDDEAEQPIHFESIDQAIEYARNQDWTVTANAVSYGPRIIERFAVCPEGGSEHDEARELILTASIGRCGRCKRVFDPADRRFDGRAQFHETGYCGECIDGCHEAGADHRCVICAPKETAR
ncbi:MAG: hypothetical protein ACJ786_21805 [Catenulispora sp.]|jgi:hypothetical protein